MTVFILFIARNEAVKNMLCLLRHNTASIILNAQDQRSIFSCDVYRKEIPEIRSTPTSL
jgi:hypothetical protein